LDEHQFGLAGLLDIAARCRQRQPAIGVGAKRRIRQRLAYGECDRDLFRQRLYADLQLEELESLLLARMGLRDVLVSRLVSEAPHRLHSVAAWACDDVDQSLASGATNQVQGSHLHGGMGSTVAKQGAVERRAERHPVVRVFPHDHWSEVIPDGRDKTAL